MFARDILSTSAGAQSFDRTAVTCPSMDPVRKMHRHFDYRFVLERFFADGSENCLEATFPNTK